MITDQRQTGVPNGNAFSSPARTRTQLVKPNQVTNIGRSLPQNQNLAPQAGAMGMTAQQAQSIQPVQQTQQTQQAQTVTPQYNPIFQAQPQATAQPIASTPLETVTAEDIAAARPSAQSMEDYLISQARNPQSTALPSSATSNTSGGQQLTIADKDVAREAIRKMKSTDIIELLDELARGTLTGID